MSQPFLDGSFPPEIEERIREADGLLIEARLTIDEEGVINLDIKTPLPKEKEPRIMGILARELVDSLWDDLDS